MKKILCMALFAMMGLAGHAQSSDNRLWGIQASIGVLTIGDITPVGQLEYFGNDQADHFSVSADYYIRRHVALTGGLYYDRIGLLSDYSDNIGLKKIGNLGLMVGAKYYFLPSNWFIQPFIGASLKTNFMNVGKMSETDTHYTSVTNQRVNVDYNVQCPALRIVPRIGADLRLCGSLYFCAEYQVGYGLWGYNRQSVHHVDGSMAGTTSQRELSRWQTGFNIGLKLDFPVRKVTAEECDNLLQSLFFWLW